MTNDLEERKLAFRPDQAARILSVSRDVIFKLLSSGELRSWKLGAARLISAGEIDRFIHSHEQADDGDA